MGTLIDRVREDIGNADANGYDVFNNPDDLVAGRSCTDSDIARDLRECTDTYEHTPWDDLVAAIAAIRAERA